MSETNISTLPELILAIESAWDDLQSFLAGLTESEASITDDNGWTAKDHATHIAVWEDSVAILFRGKPRHEALGITDAIYAAASFDQINEIIREKHKDLPLTQALRGLVQVHSELMESVKTLSDAELKTTVRGFFPQAPRTDERPMIEFIFENTVDHFTEHLQWMRELLARAA